MLPGVSSPRRSAIAMTLPRGTDIESTHRRTSSWQDIRNWCAGVAYVCFIIDAYSRMFVGWRAAPSWGVDEHGSAHVVERAEAVLRPLYGGLAAFGC